MRRLLFTFLTTFCLGPDITSLKGVRVGRVGDRRISSTSIFKLLDPILVTLRAIFAIDGYIKGDPLVLITYYILVISV